MTGIQRSIRTGASAALLAVLSVVVIGWTLIALFRAIFL